MEVLSRMIHDVMEYFGLTKEFRNSGYFETENYKQVFLDLKAAIKSGHIIALTGIVGSGKTVTIRRIKEELIKQNEILVSSNLTVEKHKVNLSTLINVLFSDLITDKNYKIPTKLEIRERQLRDLIKSRKKPVALFIDEAHELHNKTLVGLKRLVEVVQEANSILSIVLAGHPKLHIDLNKPSMEEIGARTTVIKLEGIRGAEKGYIDWLFDQCLKEGVKPEKVFTERAMNLMSEKFSTPMQINSYAWKSLVEGHLIGQKPVDIDIIK